jgi:hypothetical protein
MTTGGYAIINFMRGFGGGLAVSGALLFCFSVFIALFVMHCVLCLASLTPLLAMIIVGAGLWVLLE